MLINYNTVSFITLLMSHNKKKVIKIIKKQLYIHGKNIHGKIYSNNLTNSSCFSELSTNLFPFIEDYPSIQSPVILMNYIKLKKENPKWKNEQIAQCLNLPEVKSSNKKPSKPIFNRQKVCKFFNNDDFTHKRKIYYFVFIQCHTFVLENFVYIEILSLI